MESIEKAIYLATHNDITAAAAGTQVRVQGAGSAQPPVRGWKGEGLLQGCMEEGP